MTKEDAAPWPSKPITVGVVGLGLIGGSFAKAFAAHGDRVLGYDTDARALIAARGVLAGELDPATLPSCDLIVLAAYPAGTIAWLEEHAAHLADASDLTAGSGPLVIDTAGVKRPVCARALELARAHGFAFLGTHPMAGTEHSGFSHARADLFQGAPLVLVPPTGDEPFRLALIDRALKLLAPAGFGSVSVTTPETHDAVIAFTSQLAHVVSNAYVKSPTAQLHHGFSAGSYRDLTRVAHLNAEMWSELMMEDADYLADEIERLARALGAYAEALRAGDRGRLRMLLSEGDRIKRALDDAATN